MSDLKDTDKETVITKLLKLLFGKQKKYKVITSQEGSGLIDE